MNIDDLTIREARNLAAMFHAPSASHDACACPWNIGKNYLIRTVTMTQTGRLVQVTEHELVLEDAAWIADSGRFSEALAKCQFSEVEPFPKGRVLIGRASLIDACEITTLPRDMK